MNKHVPPSSELGAGSTPLGSAPSPNGAMATPVAVPRTNGGACAPIASTPSFVRVAGEAFDADQIGWSCDECGRDEYSCECEVETCAKCARAPDPFGYCGCKAENPMSMEDVRAQFARLFNPPILEVGVIALPDGSSRVIL